MVSGNAQHLMYLQAQPPAGMGQAVGQGLLGMGGPVRPIPGLEEEVAEVEPGEACRGAAAWG